MAMTCMEWVSFEISTFIVGSLGEVQLAVNTITINLSSMIFMVYPKFFTMLLKLLTLDTTGYIYCCISTSRQ